MSVSINYLIGRHTRDIRRRLPLVERPTFLIPTSLNENVSINYLIGRHYTWYTSPPAIGRKADIPHTYVPKGKRDVLIRLFYFDFYLCSIQWLRSLNSTTVPAVPYVPGSNPQTVMTTINARILTNLNVYNLAIVPAVHYVSGSKSQTIIYHIQCTYTH